MATRILFSEGAKVTVTAEAEDVRKTLSEDKRDGQPFSQFKGQGDADVYVAADRVAYIKQIGR